MRRQITSISLMLMLLVSAACSDSCTGKVATNPSSSPFTAAFKATDDIASSIKLGIAAESNLEQQHLITPQDGLKIIDYLAALQQANVKLGNDLELAKQGGNTSALRPSLDVLKSAVQDLQQKGLLGIKNQNAQAAFNTIMGTISIALGTLEGLSILK